MLRSAELRLPWRYVRETASPTRMVGLAVAGSLFMALCARIALPVPWSDVPLTLQTLGVYLIALVYGPRLGAATVLLYLVEGLCGLPVFSFGRHAWMPSPAPFVSLPLIIGPTAGYLFGFPLATLAIGWLTLRGWGDRIYMTATALLLGGFIILLCGWLWRLGLGIAFGGVDPIALLVSSVAGFLPGEAVKIAVATGVVGSAQLLLGMKK